jgi:predicted protein tyrosine phosphatase
MLKAINISCYEAAEIKQLPDNTVLISINECYGDVYPLKLDRNGSNILTVRFADVQSDGHKRMGHDLKKIDEYNNLLILEFINNNKDKNFIIHCHAGISRSSAVALFIHLTLGHELKPTFYTGNSNPNMLVIGSLFYYKYYYLRKKYIR